MFSDKKLKTNIKTCEKALEKILLMRGVNYNTIDSVDVEYTIVTADTSKESTANTDLNTLSKINNAKSKTERKKVKVHLGDSASSLKTQYGFIAQEIEKVLPEAVSFHKESGLKTVNYISVIPLLVEALKEQQTQIESLKSDIKKIKGKSAARIESINSIESISGTYLYQNTPNPFSQETQIRYSVPENAGNAFITITDLAGKQIKTLPIATKGESFVTLKANELYAGLFAYTLVVDGNIIDTKRMVIVE